MPHAYGLAEPGLTLLNRLEALAREELRPQAGRVDREGRFPKEGIAALAREGLLGLCVPRAQGGLGGEGPHTFAAVAQELALECASTAMVFVMHVSVGKALTGLPLF
jgi:alkylation response protein AidB-like acyl-CoA dehydrogenase